MLEIGTGWGALAVAAAERGCRVTTATLSGAQARYARARFLRENVADRISLCELDWRELDGRYDALRSTRAVRRPG